MKRSFVTAMGLGFALLTAPALAQDHGDADKRAPAHKDNAPVHRTVNEQPSGGMERKDVGRAGNGNVERRSVTQRANGNVVRRTVSERPNGGKVVRKIVRAPRRFHAARPWVAPRGFTFRRFTLGERIPSVLLAADYFLMDFSLYGLQAPPPGYVWVRDGSDAVLVDRYTGEVVQVEYDVFY